MNHRSHWAWHWLYDDKDIIEIHQPMPTDCCSRKGLQQFRALSLLLMSGVYFWQVAISKSFFVEIQYFTLHGVFLAWLYFSLISIDSYINRKGEAHETCEG